MRIIYSLIAVLRRFFPCNYSRSYSLILKLIEIKKKLECLNFIALYALNILYNVREEIIRENNLWKFLWKGFIAGNWRRNENK